MLEEKDLQAIAQLMDSRIGESEKRMAELMDQRLAQQKQEILDESTQRMKILLDTGRKSKNHAGQISAEE